MDHPQHATYVLYSLKDHEFYIGSSSDFDRRSIEHEQGRSKSTAVLTFNNLFDEFFTFQTLEIRFNLHDKISGEIFED